MYETGDDALEPVDPMARLTTATATLLLGLLGAACTSTGPDLGSEVEVVGAVQFHEEPVLIQAPDTVNAGESFSVSVRTWGGGCVSEGPTRVSRDGSTVRIEPIDIEVVAEVCTAELRRFMHMAEVTLASPGEATLRVVGRRLPADEVTTFERTVVVR